jgi:hypothetical protein
MTTDTAVNVSRRVVEGKSKCIIGYRFLRALQARRTVILQQGYNLKQIEKTDQERELNWMLTFLFNLCVDV